MKGDFVFAVPGDLDTPTGGYAYDKRMIAELRELGWRPEVLNLGDGFPRPTALTRAAAQAQLADVPKGRADRDRRARVRRAAGGCRRRSARPIR